MKVCIPLPQLIKVMGGEHSGVFQMQPPISSHMKLRTYDSPSRLLVS